MKHSVLALGLFVFAAALLAACGGNGGNQPPYVNGLTQPTPSPSPSPTPPFSSSQSVQSMSVGANTLPSAGGFSASLTILAPGSNVPSGTTLTAVMTNQPPPGVAAFPGSPLVYVGLTTSNTVSVGAGSTYAFSIPLYSEPPGTPISVGCNNPLANSWNLCAGPDALPSNSSSTQTTLTNNNAYTFNAGVTYWIAVTVGSPGTVTVP
jgi:hypothetical protein